MNLLLKNSSLTDRQREFVIANANVKPYGNKYLWPMPECLTKVFVAVVLFMTVNGASVPVMVENIASFAILFLATTSVVLGFLFVAALILTVVAFAIATPTDTPALIRKIIPSFEKPVWLFCFANVCNWSFIAALISAAYHKTALLFVFITILAYAVEWATRQIVVDRLSMLSDDELNQSEFRLETEAVE